MIESNPEGREREVRKRHAKTGMHLFEAEEIIWLIPTSPGLFARVKYRTN